MILRSLDRTREIYLSQKGDINDKKQYLLSNQRRGYPDHEEIQKKLLYLKELETKNDHKRQTLFAKMTQAKNTQYLPLTKKDRRLRKQKELEQSLVERTQFLIKTRRECLYGKKMEAVGKIEDEDENVWVFPTNERSSLFASSVKEKRTRLTRS